MSEQEWYAIEQKLVSKISRIEKKLKTAPVLAQKINLERDLKEAREQLRRHKLRYYDFVQ